MCAQYWNLRDVKFICPHCGAATEDTLQTHFMGDFSYNQYYAIGEKVPLLGNMTVTLRPVGADKWIDDFIGNCGKCDEMVDFGAQITDGVVEKVWVIPNG